MNEHHLRVSRTARFFTLGAPGPAVPELWIVTHGYGQLAADFLRLFAGLDDGTRYIVAPEALNRFYLIQPAKAPAADRPVGATWMTRVDREREISDYVEYLDHLFDEVTRPLDAPTLRVSVLGFSQGVATAARWTALGRSPVHRLVCWAGGVPEDLDLSLLARKLGPAPLRIIVGDRDELAPPSVVEAQEERLRSHGINVTSTRFSGGHALSRAMLRTLAEEKLTLDGGDSGR